MKFIEKQELTTYILGRMSNFLCAFAHMRYQSFVDQRYNITIQVFQETLGQ